MKRGRQGEATNPHQPRITVHWLQVEVHRECGAHSLPAEPCECLINQMQYLSAYRPRPVATPLLRESRRRTHTRTRTRGHTHSGRSARIPVANDRRSVIIRTRRHVISVPGQSSESCFGVCFWPGCFARSSGL